MPSKILLFTDAILPQLWTCPFPIQVCLILFIITMFYRNSAFNASSGDPVASDLGLHCLPISRLWYYRINYTVAFLIKDASKGYPYICVVINLPAPQG